MYPCFFFLPTFSECICIHLKSDVEKFYLLCLMTRKLFTYAKQECMEENPDSITCQEVLTPGQLYLMFLKVTLWLFEDEHILGKWLLVPRTKVFNIVFFLIFDCNDPDWCLTKTA